jgi:SAM-dependent methyltransferase
LDTGKCNKNDIHKAEQTILNSINDLLTYVIDPSIYDAQSFLQWDLSELTSIASFNGKIIIDVGAGTGKITFIAAPKAQAVYAVEPVANLRFYLKQKAKKKGIGNVFPVDGLITDIPFQDNFADISFKNHEDMLYCKNVSGNKWDNVEIYFVAGKIVKKLTDSGLMVRYTQVSSCVGVLEIK